MGGLVEGAKGLGGALERAWQLAKGMDNVEDLSKVGRTFKELTQQNPKYFATSADLPKGMSNDDALAFLNQKHTNPNTGFSPNLQGRADGMKIFGGKGNATMYSDDLRMGDSPMTAGIAKKGRGGVGPGTDVFDIDTMALGQNAAGKQLYPAFWDYVLSRPDAANVPTALSQSNMFRRSANMAPLYEKYGEAANRVLPHPDQLVTGFADNLKSLAQWLKLPPDAQVGLLNSIVSQGAGSEVQRIGQRLTRQAEDAPGTLDRYLDQARSLGIDPGAPWKPTTDVDASYFPSLTKWLRDSAQATGTGVSVGDSSLRRAAITSDALGGLTARDLENQDWLTNRLGRYQGGSVP